MTIPERTFKLSELAELSGLRFRGDGDCLIDGIAGLAEATPTQVSFLSNPAYRGQLARTRAAAVILNDQDAGNYDGNCLLSPNPYLSYARVSALFDPRRGPRPGIDDSARIDPDVQLGQGVSVGANAVIGPGCVIADGCNIGPGCVIGADCRLGVDCALVANITLCEGVVIGNRVIVHPGAVIGADGFGLAFDEDHWQKISQIGSVEIGDDCEIGANTTIDRGALGNTVLEDDVRLDNQIQIGHNVRIGAHTAMAGCVGISGSTQIGRYCRFAGRAGTVGHIRIADRTTVNFNSVVTRSIEEPGTVWSAALPAVPVGEWHRILVHLRRLDRLVQRVFKLENKHGRKAGPGEKK